MKTLSKIGLISLLLSNSLLAKETNDDLIDSLLDRTSGYRDTAYSNFLDVVVDIDNYLTDSYDSDIKSYDKNYILLQTGMKQTQHEDVKSDDKVKVKLYLPKLKEKYRLVFESEEEKKSENFIEENEKEIDYDLALNFRKALKEYLSINSKLGIRLSNKLNPFLQIRIEKQWPIENRSYTLRQDIKQSYIDKLELTSSFIYANKIDEQYNFSYINEYYWHSVNEHHDSFFILASLQNQASKKNSISYNFAINIDDKNNTSFKLKRYSYFLSLRHKVKKWLHLDMTLENFYREDLSFKARYAIAFSTSLYIGTK